MEQPEIRIEEANPESEREDEIREEGEKKGNQV